MQKKKEIKIGDNSNTFFRLLLVDFIIWNKQSLIE